MQIVLSVTAMLVDLSAAIMHATVFVAIMQFQVSACFMQKTFCVQYVGDNFYCICRWGSLLKLCRWYVLQCTTVSIEHKFRHGFLDCLNPICSCGLDIETTCHYLLHCPNFTNERSILLNNVSTINKNSLTSCDASIVKLLLNGDESLDLETNTLILNATVDFILSSKRFDGPLI